MARLGVDIGGTNTKFGVFDNDELIFTLKTPSSLDNLEADLGGIVSSHKLDFIGFSFAGQVDDGKIVHAQNVQGTALINKDINEWTQEKFAIYSKIDNDLKCASLAEYAHHKIGSLGVLYIGTGFGASFVDGCGVFRGSNNYACEIGHIPFKKSSHKCFCGGDSCVELFTSGIGLKNRMSDLGVKPHLIEAKKHCPEIYNDFLDGFKHAILTFNCLFNPEKIVLGGGIILANPYLLDIANETLSKEGFGASRGKIAVLSELGEFGCAYGASLLGQQ